jgi:hypothetical protein
MEIHFYCVAYDSKRVSQVGFTFLTKTKKRAATIGGRPLLEIDMLFQDRSGHLARIMIHAPLGTVHFGRELE